MREGYHKRVIRVIIYRDTIMTDSVTWYRLSLTVERNRTLGTMVTRVIRVTRVTRVIITYKDYNDGF